VEVTEDMGAAPLPWPPVPFRKPSMAPAVVAPVAVAPRPVPVQPVRPVPVAPVIQTPPVVRTPAQQYVPNIVSPSVAPRTVQEAAPVPYIQPYIEKQPI